MTWCAPSGRKTSGLLPFRMKMGICGEHGGDPASIEFCETVGLDSVSCSPFRVPIARLAAAQAALKSQGAKALEVSTKAARPRQPKFGPW